MTDTSEQEASALRKQIQGVIGTNNLRFEWMDPRQIMQNELNPKTHPYAQRQAMADLFDEIGWAGALLYNETTKRLIDGHMRLHEALDRNEYNVPVLVISVTEEQEMALLALLDKVGTLAQYQ